MNNQISFFKLLKVGYCNHPECIAARNKSFKQKQFPSLVGLIKHVKHGYILYDTGYSENFFKQTERFPEKIYALITPVFYDKEDCLLSQLKNLNIKSEDISYIIISHFHADHIAGLNNFNKAKFIFFERELNNLLNKNKLSQISNAFLNKLVPENIFYNYLAIEKLKEIEINLFDFKYGYDLFEDNSMVIINLPGHTEYQAGLYFSFNQNKYFFIADSAWSIEYLKENNKPSFLANSFFYNKKTYYKTWDSLRQLLNSDIIMIPSHCNETFEMINND